MKKWKNYICNINFDICTLKNQDIKTIKKNLLGMDTIVDLVKK